MSKIPNNYYRISFHCRYRLLGYTLELATRVNSMGKPMKILISLDTKELLESSGGFQFERHGTFDTQVSEHFLQCKPLFYNFSFSDKFNIQCITS